MLRKFKKLIGADSSNRDNLSPRPHHKHRDRNRKPPPPLNMQYGPLPGSFFDAVNGAREDAGYEALPVFARKPQFGSHENLRARPVEKQPVGFNPNRPKPREQQFNRMARDGSSDPFHDDIPGTPIKFRRRNFSHEFLDPRGSVPFYRQPRSVPGSPELMRHFQQREQVQDIARQQQQQREMMMGQQIQFFPQFQQPFYPMVNPNMNVQGWYMASPQPVYPFY